jgi:hypothetical protein
LFHCDQFFSIAHEDGRADGRPSCYDSRVIRPAQVDHDEADGVALEMGRERP